MYNFQYVTKKKLRLAKEQLFYLIRLVQDDVREHFTFQYQFVGSYARNMVTYDPKSNIGYDFDVNIMVNDNGKKYSPKKIRDILKNSFNKFAKKFGYDFCEDNTRVFTIKVKDNLHSRILHSCDFAIVFNCGKNKQKYIRFNKKTGACTWEFQPKGFYRLPEKTAFCKDNGLWDDVLDLYLEKKNSNIDLHKKSRSIFAETVHEVCQQNGYK